MTAGAVAHQAVRVDPVNVGVDGDVGAVAGGGRRQGRGHRTHPADGDVPFPAAAAQDVVKEADVLGQRRVVETGEGADQGVGSDHTANQVIADRGRDGGPDRFLHQGPPRSVYSRLAARQDVSAGLFPGAQRFEQRRPQPCGHQLALPVERREALRIGGRADRGEPVGADGALRADE